MMPNFDGACHWNIKNKNMRQPSWNKREQLLFG
jgi:hypothetical protein